MRAVETESLKENDVAFRVGAFAAFLLAVSSIIAPLIYLTGNLNTRYGPFIYSLADFLYGPVWAASLVAVFLALRERLGKLALRRMELALLAGVLAGAAMVMIACIRSANRFYHIAHPELHLVSNQSVLVVWTTLVAGVTGAGWHIFGWLQLLLGSSGWSTRQLPRLLNIALLGAGIVSLFVYVFPVLEGFANAFAVIWSVWLGILFLKVSLKKTRLKDIPCLEK